MVCERLGHARVTVTLSIALTALSAVGMIVATPTTLLAGSHAERAHLPT